MQMRNEADRLMAGAVQAAVSTEVNAECSALVNSASAVEHHQRWQQMIGETLLHWLADPQMLEDDGFDAPEGRILRLALDYAELLSARGAAPPTAIVPDPNGGVVFERRNGRQREELHFLEDGVIEVVQFRDGRLISRRTL